MKPDFRLELTFGDPPPEKPPLQELALQVPTAVRKELSSYLVQTHPGSGSTAEWAMRAAGHILQAGIQAYLAVEHAGMEQVWAALEKDRVAIEEELASKETPAGNRGWTEEEWEIRYPSKK